MADAFNPEAWLAARERARTAREKPFDPEEFLRKKAEERAARAAEALPPQDPTDQMFVAREAYTDQRPFGERAAKVGEEWGKTGLIAGDTGTFGLANRTLAYGRALADAATGGEMDYGKRVAEQNAFLKRIREEDAVRAAVGDVTGGLTGGAGLAKAGITLAKPGVGWISRAIRGGTEGALQTAASAAGQSYGTAGQKLEAAVSPSTMLGGVFGAGAPLAASGAAGVKTLFDMYKGHVPKYPPFLLRAVDADRAGVEALPAMGPEAMLVDAGPSMLRAGAVAKTGTGPGSSQLENALRTRERGTTPRLRATQEELFGPDVVPRHVEADIKQSLREIGPEWEAAHQNSRPVDTWPIKFWLEQQAQTERGAAGDAMAAVSKALNIKGRDALDPNSRTLHATRKMIDGMLFDKDVDPNTKQLLTEARRRISDELHDKVPGMAVLDARTSEQKARQAAFERGQELFDTGRNQFTRPVEWVEEKAGMSVPRSNVPGPSLAPRYSEMGTRAEVGRIVETGVDDLRALERRFGPHTAAVQHLATQFGIENTEQFARALQTNRHFRESFNKIVHGSKTGEVVEGVADTERGYLNLRRFTDPSGVAIDLAGDALARAQAGYGASVRNRIAEVLATRGPALDELRRDLLKAAEEQARNDLTRTIVESAARRGAAGALSERRK